MIARIAALSLALALSPVEGLAAAQDPVKPRLEKAWGAAAEWLVSQQAADGSWKISMQGKEMPSVAYSALVATAFANAPAELKAKVKPAADKAFAFVLSKANEDGSFGEGPKGSFQKTYTTGIALVALSGAEKSQKTADAIRGAQSYLKANQLKEGPMEGGLGYGDAPKPGQPARADLSVAGFAAEGLKMSGLPADDAFWKLIVKFVRKCQNNTEVNTDPAFIEELKKAGLSIGNDGGLFYSPVAGKGASPAGTVKISDKEIIASYGAMTYDGIKTYLYAGLPKDSPEVKAAMDWVRKNYSVEAHPGFAFEAQQRPHLRGLYYYYLLKARALDAFGENPLVTFDGKKHDWAAELGEQLVKTIKDSKMWQNENPAWYESDPILCTSYVLITADVLIKNLK